MLLDCFGGGAPCVLQTGLSISLAVDGEDWAGCEHQLPYTTDT